ncbi:DUF3300 domain-containing protein [Pseudoxanthomonas indica]|uniref:DUF3300 domain-containing protein n=1 Tax=Pseudoxanthomonas indica TaxID=428993 RepID=A0A1T5M1E8_9GAMM|nr:DUF3300 domain-containing protein [Pseudoxanthomonas indica]GGD60338.1 hypothetical protein GCM10007235_35650 [Pseudoxanthomonas indica]SKC82056.1 Protein of unknown function [Pseudoxanthomonas indica]
MRYSLVTSALIAALALSACKKEAPTPAATPPAATPAASSAAPAPAPVPAAKEAVFEQAELDQMVAPIALYPDSLLAQVLMAATYPGDVADAVTWSKANPKAQGDEAVKQVATQPWDPSVQSLVAFPQALALMGQDPGWVQRLGDAFLAQPDDVMDAVQRLRRQAQAAGNLQSNEYQKVAVQPAAGGGSAPAQSSAAVAADSGGGGGGDQIIVIEPASPDVVYVPSYNPTTVYGAWAYPSYPPAYYPPPSAYYPVGTALASGLAFGVGLAITDSLWGGFDWNDNDVDINVNRYNNVNVNNRLDVNQNRWTHDPRHRDGVPYRDSANRERNGRQLDGADRRNEFRGDDASRAQARARASESMQRRGVDAPARNNQQARDSARQARDQAGRSHAGRDLDNLNQRQPRPQAGGRDAARDRAASTASSHQARDRAHSGENRSASANRPRSSQANNAARNNARQHNAGSNRGGGSAQNNAFAGASRSGGSHAATQRGNNSRAAGNRSTASARGGGGGHQVNRASHPPQRQGGGGRHR